MSEQALREALEAVEWVETEYDGRTYQICPWCHAQLNDPDKGHRKKCLRQAALASLSEQALTAAYKDTGTVQAWGETIGFNAGLQLAAQHRYSHGRNGSQCSCGIFFNRGDVEWPQHIIALAQPATAKPNNLNDPATWQGIGHELDSTTVAVGPALAPSESQTQAVESCSHSDTACHTSQTSRAGELDALAQEILKPHWPVVRNMEENEARQKEVNRIAGILRRATRSKAGKHGR